MFYVSCINTKKLLNNSHVFPYAPCQDVYFLGLVFGYGVVEPSRREPHFDDQSTFCHGNRKNSYIGALQQVLIFPLALELRNQEK